MDIHRHKLGVGIRDNCIQEDFGGGEICCSGADVAWIVDQVSSDCDSRPVRFGLLWSVLTDGSCVGGSPARGNGGWMDETYGISSLDARSHSLRKASKFIRCRALPPLAQFWMVEELLVFQGRSCVGVDDSVGETEECLVKSEFGLQKQIMLWSDRCNMISLEIIDVFNEGGWLFCGKTFFVCFWWKAGWERSWCLNSFDLRRC